MQPSFTFISSIARLLLCACLLVILPAHAKRLALVMGNDNYTSVTKLQKAGNDATAMARELKAAGFTVQLHKDLNYRGMVKAVETFTNSITGGDEVVVFYAGHGVQIKTGSYLLPTDIEASSESEVEKTAYELNALTDKVSEAKPAFSLVMVDACRDNPLKAKGRSVGITRGLSAVEPPKGQMVVYSASRGQQALDRLSDKDSNPNGVFTREFIARMKKPGVKIEDLIREVQDSVEALAKTVSHEQRPAIYNEARGNFYFFGPTTMQTTAIPLQSVAPEQKDEKFWEDSKAVGNKEAFEAYLQRYPSGIFANLAKANISRLSDITKPTATPAQIKVSSNPPGDVETQQLYRRATEQNDSSAQYLLGDRYRIGRGGLPKDELEALKYYRLSANQGNADGQFNLAFFYSFGRGGLVENAVEAEKYYRLSANQGNANSQSALGEFYLQGRGGLAKSEVEAEKYYRLAANQGNPNAQAYLGYFYHMGFGGLVKNEITAEHYLRLSANQKNPLAQFVLGLFYANGRGGLNKDDVEAAKYYKLSADQGNSNAQTNLAEFYLNGRGGLAKSEVEAEKYYRLAANQDNAVARLSLAKFYEQGLGWLSIDLTEALKFYRLAAAQGNKEAQGKVRELEAIIPTNLPSNQATLSKATTSTDILKPGAVIKDCIVCPDMVLIPAGSFEMGSNDDQESRPVHQVSVSSFLMSMTEVTQGHWKTVMGNNPSYNSKCGDNCPVEQVSWSDAQEFANRLSQKTGKLYRLPSEAEWEYAARSGSQTKWSFGDNVNFLGEYAWFTNNSNRKTQSVGLKNPNGRGLFDMHGNVWEMLLDCWSENYSGAPKDGSPFNAGDCTRRVVRGGSWSSEPQKLRSAYRDRVLMEFRDINIGFRVARALDEDAQSLETLRNARRLAGMQALNLERVLTSYADRIRARIKPNIAFIDDVEGNPKAEVEVRVGSDGRILSRKLIQASGNKDWDEAVLKAIDKTGTLPRDTDGKVAPVMIISFRPKD